MAAKLILIMDGYPVKEYPLTKERMTIGRKNHNDIVIDNLAVSGEHAAVVTILHDSFLEDLDSTNGLEVNGARSKKHFLQNNDVIEIGKHKLKYVNDQITQMTSAQFERTMVVRSSLNQSPISAVKPVKAAAATITQTNLNKFLNDEGVENTGKFPAQPAPKPKPVAEPVPPVATTIAPPTAAPVKPQVAAPVAGPSAAVQILSGPNAGKELDIIKSLTTLGKPGVQVAVLTRRPLGFFITHVEGDKFPSVNGQKLSTQPRQLNDHDVIELAGIKMEFYFKS